MKAWKKGAILGTFVGGIYAITSLAIGALIELWGYKKVMYLLLPALTATQLSKIDRHNAVVYTILIWSCIGALLGAVVGFKKWKSEPPKIKKGIALGAIWGLISAIGFGFQLTKPITEINPVYDILFLPASITARVALGPALPLIILYPIISIIVGMLIGSGLERALRRDY